MSDIIVLARKEVEDRLTKRRIRQIVEIPQHVVEIVMAEEGDTYILNTAVFGWMAARLHTEKALGEFMKMFQFTSEDLEVARANANEELQFYQSRLYIDEKGATFGAEFVNPPEPTVLAICLVNLWLKEAYHLFGDIVPEFNYARAELRLTNREDIVRRKLKLLRFVECFALTMAAIRVCIVMLMITFSPNVGGDFLNGSLGAMIGYGVVIAYTEIRHRMLYREYEKITALSEHSFQVKFTH